MNATNNTSNERSIPVPTTDKGAGRRFRISLSTLINLGALIVLFTVIFALQQLSSTVEDQRNATSAPAAPSRVATAPAGKAITAAGTSTVVDLAALETTTATKAAPKKQAAAPRSAQRGGIGWADRQHSTSLVRQLDGSYHNSSTTAYRSSASAPRSYASSGSSYSSRAAYSTAMTSYRSDLDDAVARQHYLDANRQPEINTTYRATTTPYPAPIAEPTAYQETTPPTLEASRKPAWEVTVGQR